MVAETNRSSGTTPAIRGYAKPIPPALLRFQVKRVSAGASGEVHPIYLRSLRAEQRTQCEAGQALPGVKGEKTGEIGQVLILIF